MIYYVDACDIHMLSQRLIIEAANSIINYGGGDTLAIHYNNEGETVMGWFDWDYTTDMPTAAEVSFAA